MSNNLTSLIESLEGNNTNTAPEDMLPYDQFLQNNMLNEAVTDLLAANVVDPNAFSYKLNELFEKMEPASESENSQPNLASQNEIISDLNKKIYQFS